ncbi:RING/U-box superfamily protein [Euphorbia peplus]|nr:RING/U-box superfamily protein [Euphorbia peplus]
MGNFKVINTISSYDTNIMLAAIISLLVVILFILLLHIYAKFHFTFSSISPSSSSSISLPSTLIHHNFHSSNSSPSKGLDPSLVASIPLFIFEENEKRSEECVICLSVFEADEVGRKLKKCGHCFHVECIDMWLHSHMNCPICRAPAVVNKEEDQECSREDQIVIIDEVSGNNEDNLVVNYEYLSPSSSSSMGCSLMRMLSGNRSEGFKVFPYVHNV